MTTRLEVFKRPAVTADYRAPSRFRPVGIAVGLIGVMLAVVTLIANIVAAGDIGADAEFVRETLAWSFGLTTTAFGTLKFGIALILIGILGRLWLRVESVKASVAELKAAPNGDTGDSYGNVETPFGRVTTSAVEPEQLPIHKMAKALWFPMLAMGVMAVLAGLVLSVVWAGASDQGDIWDVAAWTQGLQFLGEAFLLSGIAFLLGSILASLRNGGGEVQEHLGVTVKTLKMPASAKAFVGLMMAGLMLGVAQFVLYIVSTTGGDPAAWFAWLGPLRELSLGLILSGIVLALYTIGTVLEFQFSRIREIVTTGR